MLSTWLTGDGRHAVYRTERPPWSNSVDDTMRRPTESVVKFSKSTVCEQEEARETHVCGLWAHMDGPILVLLRLHLGPKCPAV